MSQMSLLELEDSIDYHYFEHSLVEETVYDVWDFCVVLSVIGIFPVLINSLLVNFVFGVTISFGVLSESFYHVLSGSCGLFLLFELESPTGRILIFCCFILSYLFLYYSSNVNKENSWLKQCNKYFNSSYFIKFPLIIGLVLCSEYFLLEAEVWLQIRGVLMVFIMKIISLTDDVENGLKRPSFLQYFGYIFCSANILFGPWISYETYIELYKRPPGKSIWWIIGILRAVVLSIIFLTISNCWANFLTTGYTNIWLLSYKEALSFRSSHYFISFLSEATMLAMGFKNSRIWSDRKQFYFVITNPLVIEFPTSLSIVITNWNRPMHIFLKKYVYRSWLSYGKFAAILSTFVVSSFLHGFEMKVSVVLITIGVFSFLQYIVREYISKTFDCCLKIHPCNDDCTHKMKRSDFRCQLTIFVFSLFTVLHLIFLGVLMDSSTDEVGIYEKWYRLYFISFWIMAFNYLLCYS